MRAPTQGAVNSDLSLCLVLRHSVRKHRRERPVCRSGWFPYGIIRRLPNIFRNAVPEGFHMVKFADYREIFRDGGARNGTQAVPYEQIWLFVQ